MTDDKTAGFLAVEKVARNLANSLARLDDEANRYSSAAIKLDEAAQATQELAIAVRDVGNHAAEALLTISSVGGPEILARLSALEAQNFDLSNAIMAKQKSLSALSVCVVLLLLVAIAISGAKCVGFLNY